MRPDPTETLVFRSYEPGDCEAVWRLHDEALQGAGAHLGDGPWDDDLNDVEAVYLHNGGEFLVGIQDGRLVVMAALRRTSGGRAVVTRMRVDPDYQGRGIGQVILDALHRRAGELGYRALRLDTTVQQRVARRLYEKNGYREVGRGTVGPFECLYYERDLVG